MQQAFSILNRCAVIVQQGHAVRQNQIKGATIGGILHLRQNRHNGVVGIFQQGRCQCQIVAVQRLGTQITILFQIGIPRAKPDFGFAGRHRQTVAAKVGACGGVRHIRVEDFTVKGVRLFFFSRLIRGWCRDFRSSCTGVGAAGIGLPVVGFGFISLSFLSSDRGFLRRWRFGKRTDG